LEHRTQRNSETYLRDETQHHEPAIPSRSPTSLICDEIQPSNLTCTLSEKAMADEAKPPCPPFTRETANQKVKMAQDVWNTK